jgi:fumarate hydratase, class I
LKAIVELIRECAVSLPEDVEAAIASARKRESGVAAEVLDTVLENIRLAREKGWPLCQDTGTPSFHVTAPSNADRGKIRRDIVAAVRRATVAVPLRPNAVDPVSGANSSDNVGLNVPSIHFREWGRRRIRFELMLKGGGSENVTQLYQLPDSGLSAGRDLRGVVKCVLDAVNKAQGRGCPPYVVGVGVGGMADGAIALAKEQLIRELADENADEELAALEAELLKKVNALGIGPMGLGGKTTALTVKVGKQHRHPASYFVAVSFACWACRRSTLEVKA